ncbi:hypothetical protein ABWJ92_29035 [Streptomyces sp. NPDC000609]|uniref:hypothetical protein n=1 Tax=Streptomyces sp. NPDC000609 TaxID=3160957 RepID=UPI00339A173C
MLTVDCADWPSLPFILTVFPTPGNRAHLRARTRLRHTCDLIIAERRADGTDRGDLLPALVAARDLEDGGRGMTEATLALATITARWSLKHLPGRQQVRPVLEASFGPGELRMRATPR